MWRTPLICLFLPALLLVATGWFTVSPWGFGILAGIWAMLSLPAMLAVIGILVCPFFLISQKRRRGALLGLVSSLAFTFGFFVGVNIDQRVRRDAFLKLAERSEPLIRTIHAYEAKHGVPPLTMQALDPEFLAAVPQTGMGAYPDYRYAVGEEAQRFSSNPWALYVLTPSGGISFDKFLYFPLQNYPEKGFGGWLERIGDWAYVHE